MMATMALGRVGAMAKCTVLQWNSSVDRKIRYRFFISRLSRPLSLYIYLLPYLHSHWLLFMNCMLASDKSILVAVKTWSVYEFMLRTNKIYLCSAQCVVFVGTVICRKMLTWHFVCTQFIRLQSTYSTRAVNELCIDFCSNTSMDICDVCIV